MENGEKRQHPRYTVQEETFIFCNDNIGQIVDISLGGMAIDVFFNSTPPKDWEAALLCKAQNAKINSLPLKIVHKAKKRFTIFGHVTRTIGVKLDSIDTGQQEQIRHFVSVLRKDQTSNN